MESTVAKLTWYWYAARDNELFLDLDSPQKLRRALRVLRLAMRRSDSMNYPGGTAAQGFPRRFAVDEVFLFPSMTPGHCHLVITLELSIDFDCRVAWSLWMGGDPLRAAYALQRHWFTLTYCELFACRESRLEWRASDSMCGCEGKHKEEKVTRACPALRDLLGKHAAADYFPRVRDERKKLGPLMLPWGKLSKRQIERWEAPQWTRKKLISI